jgi:hypothetical protein
MTDDPQNVDDAIARMEKRIAENPNAKGLNLGLRSLNKRKTFDLKAAPEQYSRTRSHVLGIVLPMMAPNDFSFFAGWTRELARFIRQSSFPVACEYPGEIEDWCKRIECSDGDGITGNCAFVRKKIQEIDYEDGWPVDRYGNALNAVCLGMLMYQDTRWPDEAAESVFRLITGMTAYNDTTSKMMREWKLDLALKCAEAAE